MLLPSIVGAVVPECPIRGTLVLTSRRPRGTPSKPCFCFSSPPPIHAPCNALSLTFPAARVTLHIHQKAEYIIIHVVEVVKVPSK